MKKFFLFTLFALMATQNAYAQTPWTIAALYDPQNWFKQMCPTCGVAGYVDVPVLGDVVSRTNLLKGSVQFQGWGFECVSGQPIDRVDVYVETDIQNPDGTYQWKLLTQASTSLSFGFILRSDVRLAYQSMCPNVSDTSGWSLQITNWPDWALGARRVTLILWKIPFNLPITRTYNIVP